MKGLKATQVNSNSYSGKKATSQLQELLGLGRTLIVFLAIAFLLRASVVEAFKIPSSSMVPTLQIGDHILVYKLQYGLRLPLVAETLWMYNQPKRGDIVVFTLPDDKNTPEIDESDTNIIKRIIALPGDLVEVRGMKIYINRKLYPDEYAIWLDGGKKDFGPELVPEGHVLMLGDNRDYSKDSRYWDNPFLEIKRIKGKAFVVYWSSKFDFSRIFKILR